MKYFPTSPKSRQLEAKANQLLAGVKKKKKTRRGKKKKPGQELKRIQAQLREQEKRARQQLAEHWQQANRLME